MDRVEKNQKVTLTYILKDEDGNLIEQAPENNPLSYLHGYFHIVPGLENHLEGKTEEERFEVVVKPDKAYGKRVDDLIISVEKKELESLGNLEVGMEIEMYQEEELEQEESPSEHFWVPKSPEDLNKDTRSSDSESEDEPQYFVIIEVSDEYVILDGNHFLAGKDLYFSGKILGVESATFEEIENTYLNSDSDEDGMF